MVLTKGKFSFEPGFFLTLSLIFCFYDFKTLLVLLGAAMVHELGHLAALRAMGAEIRETRFGLGGITIYYEDTGLSYKKEAICAAAGPFAGAIGAVLSALLYREFGSYFLLLSLCVNGMITVFNLLPLGFLDGGRVLRAVLYSKLGCCSADKILAAVQALTHVFTVGTGAYAYFVSGGGAIPLIISLWMFILCCKNRKMGVKSL